MQIYNLVRMKLTRVNYICFVSAPTVNKWFSLVNAFENCGLSIYAPYITQMFPLAITANTLPDLPVYMSYTAGVLYEAGTANPSQNTLVHSCRFLQGPCSYGTVALYGPLFFGGPPPKGPYDKVLRFHSQCRVVRLFRLLCCHTCVFTL